MKKRAFTLAELMISLVVIGAIAALTIPALLSNVYRRAYINSAKGVVQTVKQLATDEMVMHRTKFLSSTDFSQTNANGAATNMLLTDNHFDIVTEVNLNNAAGLSATDIEGDEVDLGDFTRVTLKNGMQLMYRLTENDDNAPDGAYGYFVVDVNGVDRPNTICSDIYGFYISEEGDIVFPDGEENSSDPAACLAFIAANGWR